MTPELHCLAKMLTTLKATLRRAKRMSPKPVPEGHYAMLASGYRVHYLDEGRGPVLVLLHGSGNGACGISNFRGNISAFVAAGYRVIANDHNAYAATLARCYVEADREDVLEDAQKLIAEVAQPLEIVKEHLHKHQPGGRQQHDPEDSKPLAQQMAVKGVQSGS